LISGSVKKEEEEEEVNNLFSPFQRTVNDNIHSHTVSTTKDLEFLRF